MTDTETILPTAQAQPPGADLRLSAEDVRDLGAVLDAAIRASGYSQVTMNALRFGQMVAAAVQRATGNLQT